MAKQKLYEWMLVLRKQTQNYKLLLIRASSVLIKTSNNLLYCLSSSKTISLNDGRGDAMSTLLASRSFLVNLLLADAQWSQVTGQTVFITSLKRCSTPLRNGGMKAASQ